MQTAGAVAGIAGRLAAAHRLQPGSTRMSSKMSSSLPGPDPLSPDERLPPVEPPRATFILQLFVVPAVIVLAIVLLWLLFSWVVRRGDDPERYFAALQRPGPARWQTASNLATVLRDERHSDFKRNHQAAAHLAQILDQEIDRAATDSAGMKDNALMLREFLCKALGEFYVADPLPVLVKAATTRRSPAEVSVQKAALEAIAVLAQNVRSEDTSAGFTSADLETALETLARDDNPLIRARVAYALGVLDSDRLRSQLVALLGDGNVDVRYNAALALARQGDALAVGVLVEMLGPNQQEALALEEDKAMRAHKRATVLNNALRASVMLAGANRQADLSELEAAVGHLAEADVPRAIQAAARQSLRQMREPAPGRKAL